MIRLILPVFSKAVMIPIILAALAAECINPSTTSEKNNKSSTAWLLCVFSVEDTSQYLGLHRRLGFAGARHWVRPPRSHVHERLFVQNASRVLGSMSALQRATVLKSFPCFWLRTDHLLHRSAENLLVSVELICISIICLICKAMPVWCLVPIVSNALTYCYCLMS